MMKKLLLLCAITLMSTASMFAQFPSIGIIGDATPTGWNSDTDMTTTDGVTYTLQNFTLTAGTVKFRENDAWTNNWGGTTWPAGTGVFNSGTNIPSQPGLYNITFNRTTLAYNFEDAGNFDDISLVGGGATNLMYTLDGISYYANNITLSETTNMTFSVNGSQNWGGTGFPEGTATMGGSAIAVPANSYNVVYNAQTHDYDFNFVMVSITGDAVGGWGTVDVDMTTTDGINYTAQNVAFTAGEMKFRLNHDWGTTWGNGTFPSGTATVVGEGGNMTVPAGNYDVTFNRMTGAFAFTEATAGLEGFNRALVNVYPNPSAANWNFVSDNSAINNISISDVTGKVVFAGQYNSNQAVVNADGFAAGIYFAKVGSGAAVQTIKLIKR